MLSNCTCSSPALTSGGSRHFRVHEPLEGVEAWHERVDRRRNVHRVAGAGAADPVLRRAEFTGLMCYRGPLRSRRACISRISRSDSGRVSSRSRPYIMAST